MKTKKRSNPLTVRIGDNERARLTEAAKSLNVSRNRLLTHAAMTLVEELEATALVK
jgi:predicted HicB family RNase H-like nuclease